MPTPLTASPIPATSPAGSSGASALLESLRDVAPAPQAPFWPPAPGWWGLAIVLIAIAVSLWLASRRRAERRRGQREAEAELQRLYETWTGDTAQNDRTTLYTQGVMALLRRVAIHAGGRSRAARITGRGFFDFLNTLSKESISQQTADLLDAAQYRANTDDLDIPRIHRECEAWLSGLGVPSDA